MMLLLGSLATPPVLAFPVVSSNAPSKLTLFHPGGGGSHQSVVMLVAYPEPAYNREILDSISTTIVLELMW